MELAEIILKTGDRSFRKSHRGQSHMKSGFFTKVQAVL
jgi:hypothetical protein